MTAFVAVGHVSSQNVVAISSDGIAWSTVSITSGRWERVATNGMGTWVTFDTSANYGYSTDDGATWTTGSLPTFGLSILEYYGPYWFKGGGVFIAFGEALPSGVHAPMIYSTDGITWAAGTAGVWTHGWSQGLDAAMYSPTIAATFSNDATASHIPGFYSTDGITWTQGANLPTSPSTTSMAYGNGLFVTVTNSTSWYTSPDGITWTLRTGGPWSSFVSITFGNGVFVVINDLGHSWYSADGLTWTAGGSFPGGTNDYECVGYAAGVFVAMPTSGSLVPYYSTDNAVTWNAGTIPSGFGWDSVAGIGDALPQNNIVMIL